MKANAILSISSVILFLLISTSLAMHPIQLEQSNFRQISSKVRSVSEIKSIEAITSLLPHLANGDALLLDIDKTTLTVQGNTVTPLEEDIHQTLSYIQDKGITVLFLTARTNKDETEEQLNKLGIKRETSYKNMESLAQNGSFQNGVIYAPNIQMKSTKGWVLKAFLEQAKCQFNRIFFVDDLQVNLDSFNEAMKSLNIPEYYGILIESNQSIFQFTSDPAIKFPKNLFNLTYQKYMKGGNGGAYLLKDSEGHQWVLKYPTGNIDHFKEELAADVLTASSGVLAPGFAIYRTGPSFQLKKGKRRGALFRLTPFLTSSHQTIQPELYQQRFIVDAFLSNWDAKFDKNMIMTSSGLHSIDHGGSLRYRSLGKKKSYNDSWNPYLVTDLITFTHHSNHYKNLTGKDIALQTKNLLNRFPDMMKYLDELNRVIHLQEYSQLVHMLTSRRDFLASKLPLFEKQQEATIHEILKPDLVTDKTAAGTFVYTYINQKPYCLLGKRIGHDWYGNLGGKSDKNDVYLIVTAARETEEESMELIKMTPFSLHRQPYVDYKGSPFFRTYFIEIPYLPLSKLHEKLKQATGHQKEYTEFVWTPIEELKDVLPNLEIFDKESKNKPISIKVYDETIKQDVNKKLVLHAPFAKSMKQDLSLKELETIIHKHTLPLTTRFSWPEVKGETTPNRRPVPFGLTANGKMYLEKKNEQDENNSQIIALSPEEDRVHTLKTIVCHANVMRELKEETNTYNKKPDQTAFSLSPNEEVNKEKSPLHIQISKAPYTQSQAFLITLLGKKYKNSTNEELLYEFFTNKNFQKNDFELFTIPLTSKDDPRLIPFTQCLEREQENKDKIFLYHGTTDEIGALYDIYTEFRHQVTLSQSQGILVRGIDQEFENISSISEFIDQQVEKQKTTFSKLDNYKCNFERIAISTNLFLTGNYDIPSSYTPCYFYRNFSSTRKDFKHTLTSFLGSLGLVDESIINDLEKAVIKNKGRLFQFALDPDIADEWAYSSSTNGKGIEFKKLLNYTNYHGIVAPILYIRTNVQDFPKDSPILMKKIQARFILSPKLFANSKVKTYTYWDDQVSQEQIDTYKNNIREIVSRLVIKFLEKDTVLGTNIIERPHKFLSIQYLMQNILSGSRGEQSHCRSDESLLSYSIAEGNIPIIISTLQNNPKLLDVKIFSPIPDKNGKSMTPLEMSLQCGQFPSALAILKIYLEQSQEIPIHINMNEKDKNGKSLLIHAIEDKAGDLVKFLIKSNVDLNSRDTWGNTPLMVTAEHNLEEFAKLLIDNKADVNLINDSGNSALMYAARHNAIGVAKLLIDLVENINQEDKLGTTALMIAATNNAQEISELLVKGGANVNQGDKSGVTSLMFAGVSNAHDIVRLLIKNGAKVDMVDEFGNSALMYAAWNNAANVAKILIENNANTNLEDHQGNTALMWAARKDALDVAKILIQQDPTIDHLNAAYKIAEQAGSKEVQYLIFKKIRNQSPYCILS